MYIEIDGIQLFYRLEGKGEKTILALHGGPGSNHKALWPALQPLARDYQILLPDHRGMGRSDRGPVSKWNLETWASDTVSLTKKLGIQKPIVLGQSFGGWLSQKIACNYPGFASLHIFSSTSPRERIEEVREAFLRRGSKRAANAAEDFFRNPNDKTWEHYKEVAYPLYSFTKQPKPRKENEVIWNTEVLFHFWKGEMRKMDYRSDLSKVKEPSLVVVGREDPITPPTYALELVSSLQCTSELAIVEGAGHGVWRDKPELAFSLFCSFIERYFD